MQFLLYFQYLRFIPLLAQLIAFIRKAESTFKSPGSGQQKLAAVVGEFTPVVQTAAALGLIPQKLADEFVNGAPALISIIVQIFNSFGGVPPASPASAPAQP